MQPLQFEVSQIEISRLSRQQYCQINHDARACYDRILPNIAALATQKYGVHKDLVNLHYKTLTNTKYRVKIIGGNKTFVFSNSSKTPIYGTGQGSGNSPIIWLFISDTIAQIMEISAIGALYATDDSKKILNLKMTTYVDDVNTHHTNTDEPNNIEYNMRHDYNKWKSLLKDSGGQLAPEKCNYYLTQWTFQPKGKPKMELARATQHEETISKVINPIQTMH
jgi:hypothetical protein